MGGGAGAGLRSRFNPVRTFVIVAALDAITLTLCIASLRSWGQEQGLQVEVLRQSALELFNTPKQLTDIATLSLTQAVIAAVGLLYYTTFIKSASSRVSFQRTDDDLRALASLAIFADDFKSAQSWIDQEKQRTAVSYALRAQVALAGGKFDVAVDQVHRGLRVNGEDESDDNTAGRLVTLSLLNPMPSSRRRAFFEYMLSRNYSDAQIAAGLDANFARVDDPDEFINELMNVASEDGFPLTRAILHSGRGEFTEASAILVRSQPGSEIEELLRFVWGCTFTCLDPMITVEDTRTHLHKWFQNSYPIVQQMEKGITGSYRASAMNSLVSLNTVIGFFIKQYGYELPYTEEEGRRSQDLLLTLAREFSESSDQFARSQQFAHRVWNKFISVE